MTTTTEARRALLALLLDRAERAALLPAERMLLRPLVLAEQEGADRAEQVEDLLRIAHETSNRSEAKRAQAAAVLREVLASFLRITQEGITVGFQGPTLRPSDFARWHAALDGPSPTPDDTPTPAHDALRAGQLATPYSSVTDWATNIDEQCPAHYQGDSPHLTQPADERVDYRCGRRSHGRTSYHAVQQGGDLVFCWTDAIATYPTSNTTPTEASAS